MSIVFQVDCTTKTCENGGVLIQDPARSDIYICQCTNGYIGDSCETALVWEGELKFRFRKAPLKFLSLIIFNLLLIQEVPWHCQV
jgi:hypothetical protein